MDLKTLDSGHCSVSSVFKNTILANVLKMSTFHMEYLEYFGRVEQLFGQVNERCFDFEDIINGYEGLLLYSSTLWASLSFSKSGIGLTQLYSWRWLSQWVWVCVHVMFVS